MGIMRACDLPAFDTSYFIPWTLDMIYAVEPGLERIARQTFDRALIAEHKRDQRAYERLNAYTVAKSVAKTLIGWSARDPRLRSSEAWDCYFDYILKTLRL